MSQPLQRGALSPQVIPLPRPSPSFPQVVRGVGDTPSQLSSPPGRSCCICSLAKTFAALVSNCLKSLWNLLCCRCNPSSPQIVPQQISQAPFPLPQSGIFRDHSQEILENLHRIRHRLATFQFDRREGFSIPSFPQIPLLEQLDERSAREPLNMRFARFCYETILNDFIDTNHFVDRMMDAFNRPTPPPSLQRCYRPLQSAHLASNRFLEEIDSCSQSRAHFYHQCLMQNIFHLRQTVYNFFIEAHAAYGLNLPARSRWQIPINQPVDIPPNLPLSEAMEMSFHLEEIQAFREIEQIMEELSEHFIEHQLIEAN